MEKEVRITIQVFDENKNIRETRRPRSIESAREMIAKQYLTDAETGRLQIWINGAEYRAIPFSGLKREKYIHGVQLVQA